MNKPYFRPTHSKRARWIALGATVLASLATLTALGLGAPSCGDNSLSANVPPPAGSVVTYHNDLSRTGQYPYETALTRAKVNATSFGKVGSLPVDGQVYAQPLYLQNVKVPGQGSLDLLFVATEHDSVYAFNAGSLSQAPIWKRTFTGDSRYPCDQCSTLSIDDTLAPNIYPEIGITATPVIDPQRGTIYVVATSKEKGLIYQKLHALNLATGDELPGSPVIIQPTLPGDGFGSVSNNSSGSSNIARQAPSIGTSTLASGAVNSSELPDNHAPLILGQDSAPADSSQSTITFQASTQLSRAALVFSNNMVYVAFSSYNDREPTHGWLVAFDPDTLDQLGAFITTPHSGDGTIWMCGGAPAVDSQGALYFATGNGDPNLIYSTDLDDSVVKVGWGDNGFGLLDFFMPHNRVSLAVSDVDLGSGGVLALPDQPGPHPHLLLAGGKQGTLYLLDRDNLGKLNGDPSATSDYQIVQELAGGVVNDSSSVPTTPQGDGLPGGKNYGDGIYGTPSYFNGHIFIASSGDSLRSYPLVNGKINVAGMTKANEIIAHRGATLSISSNGTKDGIVWVADPSAYTYSWHAGQPPKAITDGPTVLIAYSTDDLSKPLYRSDAQSEDAAGYVVKYAVPTVAAGRVFLGTRTDISVYGLKTSASGEGPTQ